MASIYCRLQAATISETSAEPPRLLDRMRFTLRAKHYSYRTEQAYVHWVRRFILFHGKRHPEEMGPAEVEAFLTNLAVAACVSASTQTQALCGILFLYKHVLRIDLPHLDAVRAVPRFHPPSFSRFNHQGHKDHKARIVEFAFNQF